MNGCEIDGTPLIIESGCISFSVQRDGSAKLGITADQLQQVVSNAFAAWHAVDCGEGRGPSLRVDAYDQVECANVEFNSRGTNQNVWTFVDEGWFDAGHDLSALALTSVQFTPSTGRIQGVDVEINSEHFQLTLDARAGALRGELGAYDLRSVIQHESGHYFGLAHSNVMGATMAQSYASDGSMTSLSADDAAGICAIYPANEDIALCDSEPHGGFSTECWVEAEGCCSLAPERRKARSRDGWIAALLGLGYLLRRHLRKRPQSASNRGSRAC